jgi:hypothetical protein
MEQECRKAVIQRGPIARIVSPIQNRRIASDDRSFDYSDLDWGGKAFSKLSIAFTK